MSGGTRPGGSAGASRRLQVLFLLALLGVLVVVGLVVGALAGPWAVVAYTVLVVVLLGVGAARARALQARAQAEAAAAAGRTCTCCTTSQHDPVEVV